MTADPPAAGYSGTPQSRKLGLKPGQRVSLDAPPQGWAFADPPPGLVVVDPPDAADLVLAFVRSAAELPSRLPALVRRIYPEGALWVAWPRRAAGHQSDLTDTVVRREGLALGVVDVKVAAIDADWSALRFVWRLAARGARQPARPD